MAVASTSAANAAAKVLPPPSSFAELLRRSRFASYDPAIAQTYTSPQASARRGNYGLKRSIPMPYKDSYVTVNTFEHKAHFTEWNNAEAPVKFLKRVEELNVLPRGYGTEWDQSLGEAKTQWLMDSEFAEHNYGPPRAAENAPVDGLGRRGEGAYGSRRPPPQTADTGTGAIEGNNSQLNISALSPHQFKRYLNKLRDLSPEYREYLLEQHKSRHAAQAETKGSKAKEEFTEDELVLYISSQNSTQKLHRRFLANHSAKSFASSPSAPDINNPGPEKIERQPHRVAGLTYSHFSPLESILTTHPQPGLILQVEPRVNALYSEMRHSSHRQDYVSLFSGFVTRVTKNNAGIHLPFYNPEGELAVGDASIDVAKVLADNPNAVIAPYTDPKEDPLNMKNSSAKLRMTRISLKTPPDTVVGYKAHLTKPKEHLKSIKINGDAAVDVELAKRHVGGNPHRLGSFEYSGHLEFNAKNRFGRGASGNGFGGPRYAPPGVAGRKAALQPVGFGSLFAMHEAKRKQGKAAWRNGVRKGQQEQERDDLVIDEVKRSEGVKNTLQDILENPSKSGKGL